jgi:hypothetical protein
MQCKKSPTINQEVAMKIISFFAVIALLAFVAGCDPPDAPKGDPIEVGHGSIEGRVLIDPDIPGTVDGTVVQLFCSSDAVCYNQPTLTIVTNDNGEFVFDGVCCGTHYLGLWKDNDANGVISAGDFSFDRSNPERCCVHNDAVDYHVLNVSVVQ